MSTDTSSSDTTTDNSRVVLVTGARRGIGAALAVGLATPGATVAIHHLAAPNEAGDVAEQCRAAGAASFVVEADLAQSDGVTGLVRAVHDTAGPVDVLVNNAATPSNAGWAELRLDEWNETIAVNLTAPLLLAQALLPAMVRAGWGRIVNITSATVVLGGPSGSAYVASKAGLVGLTRSLARQVKVAGVTINAVSPGAVLTDSERELFSAEEVAEANRRLTHEQSLPRRLEPSDVVGIVQFLCSPAADAITGQTIEVNGGWFFR
jgi:NAD(P)-dependent dehydrogenase (short-subunit alcohol dehydrogenase family)